MRRRKRPAPKFELLRRQDERIMARELDAYMAAFLNCDDIVEEYPYGDFDEGDWRKDADAYLRSEIAKDLRAHGAKVVW